ncbi:MAG TPA: sulfatase [Actinomycetota bacterium]|nr:sulfatase [Actinomycetota bacterium]
MRARTAAVAALAVSVGAALAPAVLPEGDSPRPNIVVVLTDDQTWDSIPRSVAVMPYLQGRAMDPRDHWVVFPNAFVNTPLCCPSRATMLTGRFAHRTGVRNNREGPLLDEAETLAAWLDAAGYHTGLVGKYLNVYPFDRGPYVPDGWDRWWGRVQGTPETLYGGFTLIEDGEPVLYGADDHSTDVYAGKALAFLRDAPDDEPFFLWFAPNAPHPPAVPAPRHAGRYADLEIEAPPSVGEEDVADKPAWVRALPALGDADAAALLEERRASFEALVGVDEAVRAIVEELEARDELDETLIVYVSDNGLSLGEHRWVGKLCPYEECIRVPFLVRLPGVEHRIEPELVSAADLAPTIVDLAGIAPEDAFDGASLLPLLRHRSRADRTNQVFAEWVGDGRVPGWWALRRPGWVYIELETGERELYDLRRDPFQLDNLAGDPEQAARLAELAAVLAAYRNR